MIKENMDFVKFMNMQKLIHNIPDCDDGDYLAMALRYSPNNPQPNYYISLYYTVLYIIDSYPYLKDFPSFNIYKTSGICEEIMINDMFDEVFKVFCSGRDDKEAQRLMKPLLVANYFEAIHMYPEILKGLYGTGGFGRKKKEIPADETELYHQKKELLDHLNILDIIGLCFDQYPFALNKLCFALQHNTKKVPEISKSQVLYKMMGEWLIALYMKRLSQYENDGYDMMQLSHIYEFGGPLSEEDYDEYEKHTALYKRYWEEEALKVKYPPMEHSEAMNIVFDPTKNIYEDYIDFHTALKYVDDAMQAGYYNAKETKKNIKEYQKKQINVQVEIERAQKYQQNEKIEAQMQEYRDKLDRREMFWNFMSQGTLWTNKEDAAYGYITKDYDRMTDDYILGVMRENKEQKYREKLLKEQENSSQNNYPKPSIKSNSIKKSAKPQYYLIEGETDIFQSHVQQHLDNLYDEIIMNENIKLTSDEKNYLPKEFQQVALRKKAKDYFEDLVYSHTVYSKEDYITYKKGLFSNVGMFITFMKDGSLYTSVPDKSKSMFDMKEINEIEAMKDIKQFTLFEYGLFLINNQNELLYIGKEQLFKQEVPKIKDVKEIVPYYDRKMIYCLKRNGQLLEISKDGIQQIDENIRRIYNDGIYLRKIKKDGTLKLKDKLFNRILNIQQFQSLDVSGLSDKLHDGYILIYEDGSIKCEGLLDVPDEMLQMNGIIQATIENSDTYYDGQVTIHLKRYNGKEKSFVLKTF